MPLFLGIDGGGTKTRCVVGDEKAVLGSGSGSGCNIVRLGEACARDSLSGAIHEACIQAGVSPLQITRTCAGLAGAADDGIASLAQRILIEIIGGAIEVIGDMEIALESAFGGGPGVIMIAGTGSIAYGRNEKGETARAGGWGRVISDEGSGHWIGLQAMKAALHQYDRGEQCGLLRELMSALNANDVHDLAVQANADPLPEFAPLFPRVVAAAENGDAVALDVLSRAGHELAETAATVTGRLFRSSDSVAIATHGGVFSGSARVRAAFVSEFEHLCARARPIDCEVNPVMGALQRARRDFGVWHRHA